MRYSFVIPTYNRKEYLKTSLEALNNLSGYSGENYEALVIDDGSSEDLFEYIRGVNRNYRLNYIYLERGEDSCRSRTRNYGIGIARGRYIAFIDNDIVVNNDYLLELDRYFSHSDNLVIIGTRLDCAPEMIHKTGTRDLREKALGDADPDILDLRHLALNSLSYNLPAHKYPWMLTLTCNLAVPRELLLNSGGFDENFKKWGFEDIELGYRLHKAGARFVFNGRNEVLHQSHPLAAPAESNKPYFIRKCADLFKEIDYSSLFFLQGLSTEEPAVLAKYRNYQGKIRRRTTVVLEDESQLETVKKKILKLVKKKGGEVIVKDLCESTDLDIWIQLSEVKQALVSYYPRTFTLGADKSLAIVENILRKKRNN